MKIIIYPDVSELQNIARALILMFILYIVEFLIWFIFYIREAILKKPTSVNEATAKSTGGKI